MNQAPEFYGYAHRAGARCGICMARRHYEPRLASLKLARLTLLSEGWVYIPELGWCCPCWRQCKGLANTRTPSRSRIRRMKNREHIRQQSIRRNRREIE